MVRGDSREEAAWFIMRALAVFSLVWFWAVGITPSVSGQSSPYDRDLLIVQGVSGGEVFDQYFAEWIVRFEDAGHTGGFQTTVLDGFGAGATFAEIDDWLREQPRVGDRPMWMLWIGHGAFDGRFAKFNLQGPDISSQRLGDMLDSFSRPIVLIMLSSASGPFVTHCLGNDRVLIAATRSERQADFARFGEFFSTAIAEESADLDKDESISLLESFLYASRKTEAYYDEQNEVVTENAIIDDNGDGRGSQAVMFDGLNAQVAPGGVPDGLRARQLKWVYDSMELLIPKGLRDDRDFYERKVYELREIKANLPPWRYTRELELTLLDLARVQRSIDDFLTRERQKEAVQ